MNRKKAQLVSVTYVLAVLVAVFGTVLNAPMVKGDSGTIYIRADGSIDPPDAPISTVDNVTYTLTGNITTDADGIVIERNNIVIDGAGRAVQGTGAYDSRGIDLSERENVTVENTQVQDFQDGILLLYSSNDIIRGNNVTNAPYDIFLYSSTNIEISGNTMTNGSVSGLALSYYSNGNIISGNNMRNNSIYGIFLGLSSSNSINGNNITDNWYGLYFYDSSNNKFCANNFVNNYQQVDSYGTPNAWDNGSAGNYWSEYGGNDSNHDGIGDTPYVIDANNIDHYPLMVPIAIPEFPSFLVLPLLFIATLLAIIIYRRRIERARCIGEE